MSGPKYCPECGKELDVYATNCGYCGVNLDQTIGKTRKRKKRNKI